MIIVANWKAYVETTEKARTLFSRAKKIAPKTRVRIVLVPPAPFLGMLAPKNKSSVAFGAQDVSTMPGGAHTGESTAQSIAGAGASYVLVGHSERRARGESLADTAQKISHALAHDLIPILCVGERERDTEGKYLAFVREEITAALTPLSPKDRGRVIIAYEPIWAIGKTAADAISPMDLSEMILYIRKVLAEILPGKSSARTKVLYGGSVEPANARQLAGSARIDGFLVGHASVEPAQFVELVHAIS
ncbi:MAG TPA: triose-phosphate isomerase [Candidatus Paceibacterota bacterium]|nr:triose-phosphate isomerase [Candidatus Paceibacterota bacterium]